ncbi:ParB/RepB/Spo0J family partition protein [Thiopseudomonas alkaliphila]|uniref:ParB/RepB/Spo0J family partition protein n=1 Tax=Thiopseudomonas alkaliphila TaxID=1697053 RepID=UPI0025769F97|nr:ParB/RepB/Spo0J family partition protein [Thiopseudomonas alkaliphila]MDM1717338.1 ParB/RepB/Spo0J family partition protein [Thiopseudomonas alkaliphila]
MSGKSNKALKTGVLQGLSVHAHTRALGYLLVPINDVVSKIQVRKIFRNIEELAKTIKSDQQQTPITVAPKNSDGKYVILRGERRWRACKLAGLKEIKVVIDDKKYTPEEMIAAELVENIQRDNLTALEIAEAVHELSKSGMSVSDIGAKLGKNKGYVSMHIAIAEELPSKVSELYHSGHEMSAEAMYNLSLAAKTDPTAVDELCDLAAKENRSITRGESRGLLKSLKDPEENTVKKVTGAESHSEDISHQAVDQAPRTEERKPISGEEHVELQEELSSKSFAGETKEENAAQQEEPARSPAKAADSVKPILDILVQVTLNGEPCEGRIVLDRTPLSKGQAFIEVNQSFYSIPISQMKLLDVQSHEDSE